MHLSVEWLWPGSGAEALGLLEGVVERVTTPPLAPALPCSDLMLISSRRLGRQSWRDVAETDLCGIDRFWELTRPVVEQGALEAVDLMTRPRIEPIVHSHVRWAEGRDGRAVGSMSIMAPDAFDGGFADALTDLLVWLCASALVVDGGAVCQGDQRYGSYGSSVGVRGGGDDPRLARGVERLRDYSWQVVLPPSRLDLVDVGALAAFADRFEVVETPDGRRAGVARIRVEQRHVTEDEWREWRRLLMPALVPRVHEPRQPSPRPAHIVEEDWGTMTREELLEELRPRRPRSSPDGGAGDG